MKQSIEELKNLGIIPKEIEESDLIALAGKLGIANFSMDLKLDKEQIERFLYSPLINDFKVRKELTSSHQGVINKYQALIDGYKNILSGIASRDGFDGEKQAINDLINKLETEKVSYQKTVNGFSLGSKEQYFNFGANNIVSQAKNEVFKSVTQDNEAKQAKIDEKLNNIYRKLNNAKSSQNRTIRGKIKQSFRIKKLEKQMERLRGKQGVLRNRQSKLVGFNTSLYVGKMNANFDKYFNELNKINDTIEEKKYLQDEMEDINEARDNINMNNLAVQANMINAGVFERMSLGAQNRRNKRDLDKMEKRMQRLNGKMGKVNLMEQYQKVFEREYTR